MTLAAALDRYNIEIPNDQSRLIERYCQLLWHWNKRINLTRHTDYNLFVARDLVDSLALAKFLKSDEELLDLGTGGGVPGILLAILRSDLQVSLCESIGKKAQVVNEIVSDLKLPVPVYHSRAEDVLDDFRYDTVVARAVGPLKKILRWLNPHWDALQRLLLVKGPRWVEERGEARHLGLLASLELRRVDQYAMPGTESESVILEIRRSLPAKNS